MPYSDYRPDLMGHATLEPSGAFEAGSWQSFKLVYTAGAFGIDDTGSIKIGFRFATDFGPVQFTDPTAPGYTTVEASNGAVLDCRWEFKRNIRPWSRALYIGVVKHFLKPDDTITIRFGDQRKGSPGIRLQTYCEEAFEFRVLVDAIATYDYVALPASPQIAIVPGPGASWQAHIPTLRRAGEAFALFMKATDAWGNPSNQMEQLLQLRPSRAVAGLPKTSRMQSGAFATVHEGLTLEAGEPLTIDVLDQEGHVLMTSNPMRVVAPDAPHVAYWGDTHGQSDETLGTNSADAYFRFGRDRAHLDVMGHQGNDFQMTGAFWKALNRLTAAYDEPGRFVCLPGYEWSANTAVGGDRNVHYRHEGETIFRSSHAQIATGDDLIDEGADAHDAHALFEKLRGHDCVVHAHVGGRYADITFAHDRQLETAVEVHSAWGTFEWIVWDAFAKGYRVGILGNSDGHKGRPGADFPGASFFGAQGGLTCFLAPRLDRDAIFEAMRARHHYATTGARIDMHIEARLPDGALVYAADPLSAPGSPGALGTPARTAMMGDIISLPREGAGLFELDVQVNATAPILAVELFAGATCVATHEPHPYEHASSNVRVVYEGAEYRGRSRTTVWDGTITVEGTTIESAGMINNWNLDRGIIERTPNTVTFKAVTTGNFGAIDLRLADADRGTLKVETAPVTCEVAIDDLGGTPQRFEAGGLERAVSIMRMPVGLAISNVALTFTASVMAEGDTPLMVRVTQVDGHRAWSSPIYAFRA